MLRTKIRVLAIAAVIAVLMILFPPWNASLETGTINMGEVNDSKVNTKFAGYGFVFTAEESKTPFCSVEYYCSAGVNYAVLGLQLLLLAAIAGAGWWLDGRRKAA